MKKILRHFMLAAFLCLLPAAASAQMQYDDSCEMHGTMHERGMGLMGGYGGGPGMLKGSSGGGMADMESFSLLDLNADQRAKLNKIRYDLQKQHWSLGGRIIEEQYKLQELYNAERPDPKKIGAVYGAIFDVRRQMIEAKIDAMNRAGDILTVDQKAKLKGLKTPPRNFHGMQKSTMQNMQ